MAGNKNSGRKPKTHLRAQTIRILAETAPKASAYLRDVVEGKIPPFVKTYTRKDGTIVEAEEPGENPIKVDVCKYVINQDLGTPTQKDVGKGEGQVTNTQINIIVSSDKAKELTEQVAQRLSQT